MNFDARMKKLTPAKALAIMGYGESVAAYRYRTLANRASDPEIKAKLEEMADEEQGHHKLVQSVIEKYYSGADYVLSDHDKAMVTVGNRQLDLAGPDYFVKAILTICDSERQTGRFYARLRQNPPHPDLAPFLQEMAEECFEHADRLEAMFRPV